MDQELYYGLLRTLATGEIPNTLTEEKKPKWRKTLTFILIKAPNYFEKEIGKAPMEADSTVILEKLFPSTEKPRSSNKFTIILLEDTKDKKTPTNEHPNSTFGPECAETSSTTSELVTFARNEKGNAAKHH